VTGWIVACVLGGAIGASEPSDTAAGPLDAAARRFEFTGTEMAVPIELVLYAPSPEVATRASAAVFARLKRLNSVMSDYDPESELSRLSRTSGEGKTVPVSRDLWEVLAPAQEMARRSGGAFDMTVGPVVRLWRRARRHHELPEPGLLEKARQAVGYQFVRLLPEQQTVELTRPGMRLDLGGIAKGYAMAEALKVLRHEGITSAMIHAGGDLAVSAAPPGQPGWKIGIAPLELKGPPSQYLLLVDSAVATSGDTWQFVEIGGRRYSHIVDPRTGVGLTDHASVTIVCRDSITADALATAVCVLGPPEGLKLVETLPGAAAWILRAPQGKTETYQSSRWKELPRTK